MRKRKSCYYRLRLLLESVDDVEELLFQFLFLWLINQLLICFNCKPVSSTSLALSSSYKRNSKTKSKTAFQKRPNKLFLAEAFTVGYGHLE